MQAIKNIIFDFGGVFINVDYSKTDQAFVHAGITGFHQLYSQQSASPLFEELETGRISNSDFYDQLRLASGTQLSNAEITTCWDSMLGAFFPEAIEKAKELKHKYRLFLYSNTNAIHYECFRNIYLSQFGKWDFEELFEKTWYSHLIGHRKPYPESYEWILKNAGLNAAETLFIDDTLVNIEGAKQAGLQTIFLEHPMKISDVRGLM